MCQDEHTPTSSEPVGLYNQIILRNSTSSNIWHSEELDRQNLIKTHDISIQLQYSYVCMFFKSCV